VFYGNQEQIESAKEYVEKAYALRNRVSERENFYISEKYHVYITGDTEKALEIQKTWANQYPNDYIPHNNLALSYQFFGRYEEAQKEAQRSIDLSPNNVNARDNLIGAFLGQGRFDEAEQAVAELAKVNPNNPSLIFNRFLAAFLRGDQAGMDAQANLVKGKPEEADMLSAQSAVSSYYGKLTEAERLIAKARDSYKQQQRNENAAQVTLLLAVKQAGLGRCQQAKQNINVGLVLYRGRIHLSLAGLAAALCNDTEQAQSLMNELLKEYPSDTAVVVVNVPLMKAQLELNRQNWAPALEILETTRKCDFGLIAGVGPSFLRGLAYLQQKKGKEAIAEFESIMSHKGVDFFALEHPLAHLGLARAAVLTGDTARARTEYQDFLAIWKDADQDLAVIAQAKKEYEALK